MLKENDLDRLLFRSKFLKQKDYWIKKLYGPPGITEIFPDSRAKRSGGGERKQIDIPFPGELFDRVIRLSKGSDLSVYILLLSALKSLIYRYTSNRDITVVSPVNKLKISGETLNALVFIRTPAAGDRTFKELVLDVRQSILEAYENQDYPHEKLVEFLFPSSRDRDDRDDRDKQEQVLSGISCSLGNLHRDNDIGQIKTGFSFRFQKTGDRLEGHLLYETHRCEEDEALRFSNHFARFLSAALENVDTRISDIFYLTEGEKKQLLEAFNDNRGDFPRDRTVYHFAEAHAERRPDTAAVVSRDNHITYRHLKRRVDRLAAALRAAGLREDGLAVILADRSLLMVESILAVWKAGGAYIPLDTAYPPRRIREILGDSRARILISTPGIIGADLEASFDGTVIYPGTPRNIPAAAERDPGENFNMNGLSYVIYTSGSTGSPKGVMVEHTGMMNHIRAKIDELRLTHNSTVAQNASQTFDISVWQFFAALVPGGKTVVYPDDLVFDPDQFIAEIINQRVTVLEVVPSYLSVMMDFLGAAPGPLDSLEYLLVTGETVLPHLVRRWFEMYPRIPVVNAYGPTEASDDITHFVMNGAPAAHSIPIGRPILNLDIYIVDAFMNLCPVGVRGEICVSGVGVGRGYLNDAGKTHSAFAGDPFTRTRGVRLYRTGDVGRWLPDGTIEFFGRKDFQVKIRGFRIELGEIETQLSTYPTVKEAAVVVKGLSGGGPEEQWGGDKFIYAYLVSTGEGDPDITAIRKYLFERLPDYMVPDRLEVLDRMPLTPNGKVDRKVLSQLDAALPLKKDIVKPRDEAEHELAEIWADVLGVEKEKISVEANFFELGGHSLKATILAAKIHKKLNVKLSLVDVFRTPTIEGLASLVGVLDWAGKKKTTADREMEEVIL